MLARMRPLYLLSSLLVLLPAVLLPVQAQIHGVPASVTSFGFGGSNSPTPGVAASVTSLGPNGFGHSRMAFGSCCFNPFFGGNVNPPLFGFGRHRDGFRHHSFFPVGIMPVYVPYTQYVAVEPDDDYSYARGLPPIYDEESSDRTRVSKRSEEREPAPAPAAAAPPEPVPVPAQPSTVLVFKDGHRAEVGNYAIVGDTLFELTDGRTHKILLADLDLPATQKANDDLGVDFQVPTHATR
jgi:hypothetical protein